MTTQFCKGYAARSVREFGPCERHWQESGRKVADDEVIYLHDDFLVRSGIFPEDEVMFDQVSADWRRFCQEQLRFEVPPD
jgi:hypothetical protein